MNSSTKLIVKNKLNDLFRNKILPNCLNILEKYEDFSGITQVKQAQDHVIEIQKQLEKCQEERRDLVQNLLKLQNERSRIQDEINQITKSDAKWFELVKQEYMLTKESDKLNASLKFVERNERDRFSLLSSAVQDSHVKQRWQQDRTKYWGLILSSVTAFITLIISNWRTRNLSDGIVSKLDKDIMIVLDEVKKKEKQYKLNDKEEMIIKELMRISKQLEDLKNDKKLVEQQSTSLQTAASSVIVDYFNKQQTDSSMYVYNLKSVALGSLAAITLIIMVRALVG